MSWLPLILPRPNLFEGDVFPDLAKHDRYDIISFCAGRQAETGRAEFWRDVNGIPVSHARNEHCDLEHQAQYTTESNMCGAACVSLPIFTWVYLFSEGYADDKIHAFQDAFSSYIRVFIAPSFVTWTVASSTEQVYRRDRMKWAGHVPEPDMNGLPEDIPVQIILPFHRDWGSNHKRMSLAGRLEEDLSRLSTIQGWGAPLKPIRIDLPSPV